MHNNTHLKREKDYESKTDGWRWLFSNKLHEPEYLFNARFGGKLRLESDPQMLNSTGISFRLTVPKSHVMYMHPTYRKANTVSKE